MKAPDRPDAMVPTPHRRVLTAVAVVVLLLVAFRWGRWQRQPTVTVEGTVTSGGRPVVFGTVTFVAADNRVYSGTIGPDGRYRVERLPSGAVRVAVSSPDPRPMIPLPGREARAEEPGGEPVRGLTGAGDQRETTAGPRPPGRAIAAPGDAPAPVEPSGEKPHGWFRIPGRYANPLTSGLGGQVEVGTNQLDLRVD